MPAAPLLRASWALAAAAVAAYSSPAPPPPPSAAAGPPAGWSGRRVELHVHLDGSIDVEELRSICVRRGIALPLPGGGSGVPASAEDVRRYIASRPGWHRFDAVNDIVGGDAETIRSAAEAFVAFQARSGVAYTEVRYDPVRLARSALKNGSISEDEVVRAVQDGLAVGAQLHGVAVYQLLCAMRGQPAERCMEAARLAARARSQKMGGVVGFDLAGDESSYPNAAYVNCFRFAKEELRLNTTVHAGEFPPNTSAEEVRSAVLEMGVDRVGHGYAAAADPATLALLRARGVHVEACPRSAQQHGHGALEALLAFRRAGVSFGLNTDDPASFIGNTSAAEDELLVRRELGFTAEDVGRAYASARRAAFGTVPARLWEESVGWGQAASQQGPAGGVIVA